MPGTDHIQIPPSKKTEHRPSKAAILMSDASREQVAAVFDGIDDLLAACRGAPYDDRLTVLIAALIERGINTRSRIVGAARTKAFNAEKTGKFLTKATGISWRRSKAGTYSLIN
ncbi:hypothetical protein [Sphingomonas radiodurans]|uniref:hypothetical protein n=1 Tax=Sphingomonas radiodurans TaxID=2890321 RepID=UPI001E416383|nr:hypothetical protein [Sphingomonas radiodurans]WBH15291.1 hypothetical protein LLW23_10575 [Sphingomonas radiodurans]